jgi:hypothetical protein
MQITYERRNNKVEPMALALQGMQARLTVMVPANLKAEIERDAQRLGVSTADAVRMRLRNGVVPQPMPPSGFSQKDAA